MTLAIELLPASTDHVEPWPPIGRPCCGGSRAALFRDPIPPPSMLMGIVTENRTAMNPALRGLGSCACDSARRTAMSGLSGSMRGLRAFPAELVSEATATARAWAAEYGFVLPPTPTDVIDALWRLSATERELELLRSKLRSMRAAGLPLSPNDINSYKNAADTWYKAAQATINPILGIIRSTSPAAAVLIGPVPRPPGLDDPDRPLPYVPTEAELARIRSGDLSGISGAFAGMVSTVRGRLSGGVRGLALFGIDDLTIGTLVLIVIGLLAIAVTVVALAVPAYAIVQVLAAWVQARAAADVAERRRAFYERCLSTGSSSTECARQATANVPMPDPPPSPSVSFGVGGVVLGLAAAGAAYYFLATPGGRARAGLTGLRRRRR